MWIFSILKFSFSFSFRFKYLFICRIIIQREMLFSRRILRNNGLLLYSPTPPHIDGSCFKCFIIWFYLILFFSIHCLSKLLAGGCWLILIGENVKSWRSTVNHVTHRVSCIFVSVFSRTTTKIPKPKWNYSSIQCTSSHF